MTFRAWLSSLAACGLAVSAACGSHNPKAQTPKAPPVPQAPTATPAQAPPADPIGVLIATSQHHFETGERELRLGHLDRARTEFDKALDVLLESPYGARIEPRLRAQFDRLVDRINAQEMTSLAQGDGFSALKDEPAAIDELLKIATFPKPPAAAETAAVDQGRSRVHRARRPDPAEPAHLRLRRALPGASARVHRGEPDAGIEIPPDDRERLQG